MKLSTTSKLSSSRRVRPLQFTFLRRAPQPHLYRRHLRAQDPVHAVRLQRRGDGAVRRCIRRVFSRVPQVLTRAPQLFVQLLSVPNLPVPVSYTHLTLPTILLV